MITLSSCPSQGKNHIFYQDDHETKFLFVIHVLSVLCSAATIGKTTYSEWNYVMLDEKNGPAEAPQKNEELTITRTPNDDFPGMPAYGVELTSRNGQTHKGTVLEAGFDDRMNRYSLVGKLKDSGASELAVSFVIDASELVLRPKTLAELLELSKSLGPFKHVQPLKLSKLSVEICTQMASLPVKVYTADTKPEKSAAIPNIDAPHDFDGYLAFEGGVAQYKPKPSAARVSDLTI